MRAVFNAPFAKVRSLIGLFELAAGQALVVIQGRVWPIESIAAALLIFLSFFLLLACERNVRH